MSKKKEACNFICDGGGTTERRFGQNAEYAACAHICERFDKGEWEMGKGDHERTVVLVTDPVNMTVHEYVVMVTVEATVT